MSAGHSLRLRLLAGTLAAVVLIWGALAFTAWREARHEAEELFDAHLAQSAALLAAFVGDEADEVDEHLPTHRYARKVAFQIWERGRTLTAHSANAPDERLSAVEQGFSDSRAGGQDWRVYGLWDDKGRYLIQVGETREARGAIGRELAAHLLAPLAVALPLLALALVLLIGHSLRPLARLAESIGQRSPERLDAIDAAGTPRELAPLVARLNQLFARVAGSMEQERRFTADAAHELRTPLAAMRTHAEVARGADDAGRATALANVIAATDRATHLVGQLLTLARLDARQWAERFAPCDLRALATEVLAEAAPLAIAKSVELDLAEGAEPRLPGDAALLAILLRNLVDNAVRYAPAGSAVHVALRQDAAATTLEVCDQGPGIAPELRARVLERFYRVEGSGDSGAGLGLSITARIAELHGARLDLADGRDGRGLCARVVFPAAAKA